MSSKKHVQQKMLATLATIENEDQAVGKVVSVRGGSLLDVVLPDGSEVLCSVPSRFFKSVWIKRGDFVIIERQNEATTPNRQKESKVKAEIASALKLDDIKQLKRDGLWPAEFDTQTDAKKSTSSSDPLAELPGNPNRRPKFDSDSDGEVAPNSEGDYEDDDDLDLPPNPNRRMPPGDSSDDE